MYTYDQIRTVHLEITERCNAACLQCGRNINGGEDNQYLQNRELTLQDIKQFFPISFIKQLQHIYLCGNYGDPIVAHDTLEVLKYFRESNPDLLLSINTNGSARNKEWWTELAHILGKNGYVIFSIDGLKDTNHIYRQNTNWDKIVDSFTSFIQSGGIAHWEFIVFNHNEHQVEEAEQLSQTYGFKKFQIKKTARFNSGLEGKVKEGIVVKNKKGKEIELKKPHNQKFINDGLQELSNKIGGIPSIKLPTTYDEIKNKLFPELFPGNLVALYEKTTIDCKVKKERSVYISAEGIVQPCCWIGANMYRWYHMFQRTQIWRYINKVGLDNISLKHKTLESIIQGEYFKLIEDSWELPTCKKGKLMVCAKTCGRDLETFSKQYT